MTWKDDLNEEMKGSPAFKDLGDDINDLAKNYLDAQTRIGNSIRIPGEDAGDDDVIKFRARLQEKVPGLIPTPDSEDAESIRIFRESLGTAKASSEYAMPSIEGITVDEKREALMRDTALDLGISKKQFEGFLTKMYEADVTNLDIQSHTLEEDALALKKEWGVTHTNRMKALHDNLLLSEAPEALADAIKNNTAGSATTKWLDSLFSKLGETSEIGKHKEDKSGDGLEPVEAAERANEVRKKLTAPGMVTTSNEYKALLAKLIKLEGMAHPDSSKNINDIRA